MMVNEMMLFYLLIFYLIFFLMDILISGCIHLKIPMVFFQ